MPAAPSATIRPVSDETAHTTEMVRNGGQTIRARNQLPPGGRLINLMAPPYRLPPEARNLIGVWQIHSETSAPKPAALCLLAFASGSATNMQRQYLKVVQSFFAFARDTGFPKVSAELLESLYESIEETASTEDESTQAQREFQDLLEEAYREGYSDIHLHCAPPDPIIRSRVNGDMRDVRLMTRARMTTMAASVYNSPMADIKEKQFDPNTFQSASLSTVLSNGLPLKIRWEHAPLYPPQQGNFEVVLRLLTMGIEGDPMVSMMTLGFTQDQQQDIYEAAEEPVGGIVLAGVTGSGKTTTLKNLMMYINDVRGRRQKSYSVEDPVEYVLPDVAQIVVTSGVPIQDDRADSAYLRPLRSLLRMDPDVIMLGEVREREAADAIKKMMQTGHQCLTTVHTTSALGILDRLEDIGLSWRTLGSPKTMNALVYQRLAKKLCPHCSIPLREHLAHAAAGDRVHRVREDLLMAFGGAIEHLEGVRVQGPGCPRCKMSGSSGRTIVAEVIVPDEAMREMITRGDMTAARRYWRSWSDRSAISENMRGKTVLEHALLKVYRGEVSPMAIEGGNGLGRLNAAIQQYAELDRSQRKPVAENQPTRRRPWDSVDGI